MKTHFTMTNSEAVRHRLTYGPARNAMSSLTEGVIGQAISNQSSETGQTCYRCEQLCGTTRGQAWGQSLCFACHLRQVENEGEVACRAGVDKEANPYANDLNRYLGYAWELGWNAEHTEQQPSRAGKNRWVQAWNFTGRVATSLLAGMFRKK